ncbi:hypothetical protein [Roseobacter litoralis]|nr:hypothetical protein [Roseobacter litoralis]
MYMLPRKTTRIEISQDTLDALIAEKERTGFGAAKIFQYAKSLDLVGATSNLTSGMIVAWMSGKSRSAHAENIVAVTQAYRSIVFESELPCDANERRLVLITDGVDDELQVFLSARTTSVRKLIVGDASAPEGLTENKLKRLARGRESLILLSHLRFIRKAMNIWGD